MRHSELKLAYRDDPHEVIVKIIFNLRTYYFQNLKILQYVRKLSKYSQLQNKRYPSPKRHFWSLDFNIFLNIKNGENPLWDKLWNWELALISYMVMLSDFHCL